MQHNITSDVGLVVNWPVVKYAAVFGFHIRPDVLASACKSAQHQQHQRSSVLDADADDIWLLLQRRNGLSDSFI